MITAIRLPNGRAYSGTLMRPYLIARVNVLAMDDGRHYPAWRLIEYDTGRLGGLYMTRKEAMAAARVLIGQSKQDVPTGGATDWRGVRMRIGTYSGPLVK